MGDVEGEDDDAEFASRRDGSRFRLARSIDVLVIPTESRETLCRSIPQIFQFVLTRQLFRGGIVEATGLRKGEEQTSESVRARERERVRVDVLEIPRQSVELKAREANLSSLHPLSIPF